MVSYVSFYNFRISFTVVSLNTVFVVHLEHRDLLRKILQLSHDLYNCFSKWPRPVLKKKNEWRLLMRFFRYTFWKTEHGHLGKQLQRSRESCKILRNKSECFKQTTMLIILTTNQIFSSNFKHRGLNWRKVFQKRYLFFVLKLNLILKKYYLFCSRKNI